MKRIEFKQNDLKRGVPFAIIYFVAVFIFCYLKFGGMLGMANAVDNIGGSKGAVFLIGLAVLAPFFMILTMVMPKMTVEIYADKVTIAKGKKKRTEIFYNEISRLQVHVTNLNQLDFINNQSVILSQIQPQQKPEIIEEIISEISKHTRFSKQTSNKNYFGKNIETNIYTKEI